MRLELKEKLDGVLVPTVTPMQGDFGLNLKVIPNLIDNLVKGGVNVIIPCGSTGEIPSLTNAERQLVIRSTVEAARGRLPVVAGVTDTRMRSVVELANFAQDAGVDGVMITAPYYYLPSDDELFSYFEKIDQSIDLPFLFYNNPSITKFNASLDFIERLSTLDNFAGVKESDSHPVRFHEELLRFGDRIPIIPAGEPNAVFNMLSGAPGFMSVAANFNPSLMVEMLEAAQRGDVAGAFRRFAMLHSYRSLFETRTRLGYPLYIVFAKAALNLIGIDVGPPRPPLLPASDRDIDQLRDVLTNVMDLTVAN